jgi:phage terminase Nu1 subunit (DNA packaging protein)
MANSNLPIESLRWNAPKICSEFGVSRDTWMRRAKVAGITADPTDQCYSTEQIVSALFGDLHNERLRLIKGRREEQDMRVDQMRGELVNRNEVRKSLEILFTTIAQIISASDLTKRDKDELLNNISGWEAREEDATKKSVLLVHTGRPSK